MADGERVVPFDPKRRRKKTREPPPGGWPSWYEMLLKDERERVLPEIANVLIALRNDAELYRAAIFNEMRQCSIVDRVWPAAPDADAVQPVPHEVTDDDITRLQEWLQWMGMPRIGRDTVGQAVEAFAREHRFHPVKDYLEYLVWDGISRIDRWLFTYLGAQAEREEDVEYVSAIGQMFLIAMVARVFEPGCQADYMLVLEGDQGALKSRACRILAGEWFSDSLPEHITGKDARLHLRGKWLIEVSELAAFGRAEVESLKAYITRREERYRPPYGRHDVTEPRQCLFVGTTNEDAWIKDQTGGRRFWPVNCLFIDIDRLAADRDQLFAEALIAYRRKEKWWPDPKFERQFFKPQQDARTDVDEWIEPIRKRTEVLSNCTIPDLATDCLGMKIADLGMHEQKRIANILRHLGFKAQRSNSGRWWARGVTRDT